MGPEQETGAPAEKHAQHNLRQKALGGFAWMSAVNGVRAVLRIAILAILARLLTPEDFGLVAAAGVVIWLSTIFANLGVGPALVQRPDMESRHVHTAFSSSLLLGMITAGIGYAAAPLISAGFRMDALTPVLRMMVLIFPVVSLSVVSESLLQRQLRFSAIAGIELVSYAVGYGLIGIILAMLGFGVWALVGAEMAKAALKSGLFLVAVPHTKRLSFDPRAFRDLLRFGSGHTIGSLSIYFALQGDNLVVARFLGPVALGLYSRAYELMMVPSSSLGMILYKVLFPAMAKVQDDAKRLQVTYRRGLSLVALLVGPVSAATVILAPEIISTLLGAGWEGVVAPLQILGLAMYFQIGRMVGGSVTNSVGAVFRSAWRGAAYAVLVVAGSLLGQPWGLPGVAAGVALAVFADFAMISQLSGRLTGLPVRSFLALHVPAVFLTSVVGGVLWLVAAVLRSMSAPPLTILLVAGACAGSASLLLLRQYPNQVVGEDGIWMARTVYQSAPLPLRPWLGRIFGTAGPKATSWP